MPDLPAALAFFCDVPGFAPPHRHGDHAYAELGCGLRLLEQPRAG